MQHDQSEVLSHQSGISANPQGNCMPVGGRRGMGGMVIHEGQIVYYNLVVTNNTNK